jgi:hypothetical protein
VAEAEVDVKAAASLHEAEAMLAEALLQAVEEHVLQARLGSQSILWQRGRGLLSPRN